MTTDDPAERFYTAEITPFPKAFSNMDRDKVSTAMGQYMLQGWTMLNDGCPDCNTPLMRNREATSQICVNCQLNPPADDEDEEERYQQKQQQQQQDSQPQPGHDQPEPFATREEETLFDSESVPVTPNPNQEPSSTPEPADPTTTTSATTATTATAAAVVASTMSLPTPPIASTPLPPPPSTAPPAPHPGSVPKMAPPPSTRPMSPPAGPRDHHRVSVLDPMMETVRKASSRSPPISRLPSMPPSSELPLPPSGPPPAPASAASASAAPRSSTPLPPQPPIAQPLPAPPPAAATAAAAAAAAAKVGIAPPAGPKPLAGGANVSGRSSSPSSPGGPLPAVPSSAAPVKNIPSVLKRAAPGLVAAAAASFNSRAASVSAPLPPPPAQAPPPPTAAAATPDQTNHGGVQAVTTTAAVASAPVVVTMVAESVAAVEEEEKEEEKKEEKKGDDQQEQKQQQQQEQQSLAAYEESTSSSTTASTPVTATEGEHEDDFDQEQLIKQLEQVQPATHLPGEAAAPAVAPLEEMPQQQQQQQQDVKMAISDVPSSVSDDGSGPSTSHRDEPMGEEESEELYKPSEEELRLRQLQREQSDRASKLMGQKMLQGWAMLQDPCPNPTCYAVPLLRSRDKKEYCVICENYYRREKDSVHGTITIVPVTSTTAPITAAEVNSTTFSPLAPAVAIPDSRPTSTMMMMTPTIPEEPLVHPALPPPPVGVAPMPRPPPAQHQPPSSPTTSVRATSPTASPLVGRGSRGVGRVSGSIVLPPAGSMSPSFGITGQQILGKHLSDDFDKLASEDEDTRRHIQLIRKVGEFAQKSLPPVPNGGTHGATAATTTATATTGPGGVAVSVPSSSTSVAGSRPTSVYSNTSGHGGDHHHRPHHALPQRDHSVSAPIGSTVLHLPAPPTAALPAAPGASSHSPAPPSQQQQQQGPPPPPPSAEVQAMIAATNKTIATILIKLEAYRLALEVAESPKECASLTLQIKGLMECLKACRETLM